MKSDKGTATGGLFTGPVAVAGLMDLNGSAFSGGFLEFGYG